MDSAPSTSRMAYRTFDGLPADGNKETAQQRDTNVRCEGQLQVLRTKISALRPSSARCAIRAPVAGSPNVTPESWLLRWGVIYHAQVGGIFRLNRNTLSGSY
jgi:hypothetical protein